MAKKKEEKKEITSKKTDKEIEPEQRAVKAEAQASDEAGVPTNNVGKEPKAVEGEIVQTQATQQPQTPVKQGNGKKWCCCCGIAFVIFILLWILVQILSFSGMMPLPFIF